MKNTLSRPWCGGRHFRVWENEAGLVAWDNQSKSRKAAQLFAEQILDTSDLSGRSPRKVRGFIVTKLAAKRWQVIAFAADRGIEL